MPSFAHYAMVATLLVLLAGCSKGEIQYSGDTSASENQKNLATAGIIGYFAKEEACLSVARISITVPVRSPETGPVRELWDATGCGKDQKFTVEFARDSNTVQVDPAS
ncbi:hypothetical protein GCM10022229_12890 [Luteimonas lutimaris]|uniref:Lipoprotein n=1 Tax=Luteimonas lutimaris TaxID=698645 RepID=A0ABP7MGG8_9GAMM